MHWLARRFVIGAFVASTLLNSPASGTVIFQNGFENEPATFPSWQQVDLSLPDSGVIVTNVARTGTKSVRFLLRPDDPEISGGSRAELARPDDTTGLGKYAIAAGNASNFWYGWSIFVPADWVPDTQAEIISQFHSYSDPGEGSHSPPLAFVVSGDKLQVSFRTDPRQKFTGTNPPGYPITLHETSMTPFVGKWIDFVVHIIWDYDNDGLLEVWINGVKVVHRINQPFGYNDGYGYMKNGIYKWPWNGTGTSSVSQRVYYFDNLKIGDYTSNYSEVHPTGANPLNSPPFVSMQATPLEGTAPYTVNFTSTGTFDVDNDTMTYLWNFGDGTTATGPSASHVYSAPNTYTASLTVTDQFGASTTKTKTIRALPVNPVKLNVSSVLASGDDGNVAANVLDGSLSTRWSASGDQWIRFDLGSPQMVGLVKIAFYNGDTRQSFFDVQTSQDGTNYTTVLSNVESSGTSLNLESFPFGAKLARYLRIFGRGNSTNPFNSYTEVEVYQIGGPTSNQAPTAVIGSQPTSGSVPLLVSFSSTGSTDPDGSIVAYLWDFKDGTVSSNANPTKEFSVAGAYDVTLTVTDNQGATHSSETTVTVSAGTGNQAPTAVASGSPTSGTAPLSVSFSSAGSSDPDGSIVSYSWDFGDGGTSSVANPTHIFAANGNYTVVLTVTDNQGATSAATVAIAVSQTGGGGTNADPIPTNADAYVYGKSNSVGSNFGTDTTLKVKEDTGTGADRRAFLKFSLASLASNPTSATLEFLTTSASQAMNYAIYEVTNDTWSETGITWNNQPALGNLIATVTVPSGQQTVQVNVTNYIVAQRSDGVASFAIVGASNSGSLGDIFSRESSPINAAELVFIGGR